MTCPTGITGLGGSRDQIETTCLNDTDDKTYVSVKANKIYFAGGSPEKKEPEKKPEKKKEAEDFDLFSDEDIPF